MAVSQENCTLSRRSSSLMGTASTPNISQTANSNVKATVDSTRTRVAGASRFRISVVSPSVLTNELCSAGGFAIFNWP